ncbi:MAG: dihydrolipoyl dehydrogenase [Methanotrichaceae archaeon]|nr:dihydrolipoyl dehydrogenase [Methanotrichaceae archaeon]
MERFDLIVVGSGAGTHVASVASKEGLKVALVDQGPAGGVCLNNGCVPSKMLIYPADVIRILQRARDIGVDARINKIDFQKIMRRMHSVVKKNRRYLEKAIKAKENITWYKYSGEFIGDYTIRAGNKILTGPNIVIATGARALVPPIQGLKEAGYLDNVTLLNLEEPPRSLIIIGGGLVACEYGHFFSAIGTKVTIVGRSPRILKNEDPEVSRIVNEVLSKFMKIFTNHETIRVELKDGRKVVSAHNRIDNRIYEFQSDQILLAAGRRSNSDLLKPEMTGVETDQHGWIKVNEHLETNKKDIWALGDAVGKGMFRHTASYESDIVIHNMLRAKKLEDKMSVDFHSVPHAVFTNPQVAGVGLRESEAIDAGYKVLVGRAKHTDVAKGVAMAEEHGFVKVVVEEKTGKILGCSAVGAGASELVQQVVYLMNTDRQNLEPLSRSQIIHPTLNEVLAHAFVNLERPSSLP